MSDLIEALQILLKYGNPYSPTHCEHDILMIADIDPKDVSKEDKQKLDKLGFFINKKIYGEDTFVSYRFGSA